MNQIENSLPLAARASDLGTTVAKQLLEEHYKLLKTKESTPLWRKLLERDSWGSNQLRRDLELTSESVEALKHTWKRLEDLRSVLVAYRNNVAFFKVRLLMMTLSIPDPNLVWFALTGSKTGFLGRLAYC